MVGPCARKEGAPGGSERKGVRELERREIEERRAEFVARFGAGGDTRLYFAPGRVNLIGEHTDYNGGLVLPLALELGTYLLIRPSREPPARFYSTRTGEEAELHPDRIARRGDWADYVRGVFFILQKAYGGLPPFEALFFGDLPLRAGLASSASLEVVTVLASTSLGYSMQGEEMARVAWRAENEYVGVPCGIMDQYAAALAQAGTAMFLDCDSLAYRHIPFKLEDTTILIGHTGVYRSLAASDYNRRRRECEEALKLISARVGKKENLSRVSREEFEAAKPHLPDVLRMRAEHVVAENLRVKMAAECLARGDAEKLGHFLNRSHASLRDLYQVSCPELDVLQEASLAQPGVWGCRMTGAGFGGCVIALIRNESLPEYLKVVPDLYNRATGCEPFFLTTRPGGGARMLAIDA